MHYDEPWTMASSVKVQSATICCLKRALGKQQSHECDTRSKVLALRQSNDTGEVHGFDSFQFTSNCCSRVIINTVVECGRSS